MSRNTGATARLREALEADPGLSVREAARRVGCHERTAWHAVKGRRKIGRPELRAAVLADIHAPYHDADALDIAADRCAAARPDVLVLAGDVVDFYQVSKWARKPSRAEFSSEVEDGAKLLAALVRRIRARRVVYIKGNHEARLQRYLWSGPRELSGLKCLEVDSLLGFERLKIEAVDNTERIEHGRPPFSIGDLAILHGHEARISTGAVNLPRLYYQRSRRPVLVGHHHQIQSYRAPRLGGGVDRSYAVGCLANLHADYAPINDWVHGFAIVDVDADGRTAVGNYEIDTASGRVLPFA